MSSSESFPHSAAGSGATDFRTTHWSVVLAASHRDAPDAQQALAKLCKVYWYPLYAYVRRHGHNPHDAEDLTQEFFARLLDKNYLEGITREGGRFRSYLLTMVKRLLSNEWQKAQTQKRGGGQIPISIDDRDAETRYAIEPSDNATPEQMFDRRWALTVIDQIICRLQIEYRAWGKSDLFDRLQTCLSGDRQLIPYAELARSLGMTEGAVKVAVHRLRKRYGELLREEIGRTVTAGDDVEEEIRYLIKALC